MEGERAREEARAESCGVTPLETTNLTDAELKCVWHNLREGVNASQEVALSVVDELIRRREDLQIAKGDYPIPCPEPRTDMARILSGNVLLKAEVRDLEEKLRNVTKWREADLEFFKSSGRALEERTRAAEARVAELEATEKKLGQFISMVMDALNKHTDGKLAEKLNAVVPGIFAKDGT